MDTIHKNFEDHDRKTKEIAIIPVDTSRGEVISLKFGRHKFLCTCRGREYTARYTVTNLK